MWSFFKVIPLINHSRNNNFLGATLKKVLYFFIFLSFWPINSENVPILKWFGVPFHVGMKCSEWYQPSWIQESNWQRVKDLYDTYIVNNIKYDLQPRIPKIIHQIWIGSSLPEEYYCWQKSWQQYHPGWEYKLWTDKDIEELELVNKHWYDKTPNY